MHPERHNPTAAMPEQRLTLYGVSWQEYEILGATLCDRPGLRMTYLEGTLEIMTTSREHGALKTTIARLIEAYAEEMDIDLNGYGAMTFKKAARQRGLEPDECYCVGTMRDIPDIALEVVITSGGIDKLQVYAGLQVPEVWFWQDGVFSLYHLEGSEYLPIASSRFLPQLDLLNLHRFVDPNNQTQTVKTYRRTLRA
ncbi:Uma2 family endonuclease [Gloeobacter morelensis]|uniref:Uma2 family endonuclease n=1 Tax=Gloeobacter morelensis MG652769 TaxID=2781736 RepID=A0ABY3PJZ2_9CYAN|nr:Uma2 family endonuclease [Gloeobacter morelensis]UFP93990.1 Uma2 family endonuclease [Gloeobacter morelensis MG652769]